MANKKKIGFIAGGIALILIPMALGIWYVMRKPGTGNTGGTGGSTVPKTDAEIQQDSKTASAGRG